MPLTHSLPRWSAAIATSAALAILGHYLQAHWLHWICKPLTTLLILAMAFSLRSVATGYRHWILLGLLLSTVGDVFLMLPGDYFVHGLLSFLIAHLAYLWAFRQRVRWLAKSIPFVAYALLAGAVLAVLWPGIPAGLRLPVLVYVLALAAMAAQAAAMWRVRRDRACALAAIGGAFFLFSDSLIAFNRFHAPFDLARLLILLSYWLAQWLIARSIDDAAQASTR